MIIKIGFGQSAETYFATRRESDLGPAFRIVKAGTMQYYDVLPADVDTGNSECSCAGHSYTSWCKHVKALRALLNVDVQGKYPQQDMKREVFSQAPMQRPVINRPVLSPISMESITRPFSETPSPSYKPRKQRSEKQIAASMRWNARMNGDNDKIHGYDDGEAEPQSRGIHLG